MSTPDEDDLTRLSNSDDPTVLSTDHDATRLSGSGSVSSSWPSSQGQRLEAGQAFGPYTIVKLLGHGGMGEVYEAIHIETDRRVALKLLRGMMNHHEDRARFLSEGRLAASISHPHTVYIFGSEEVDGLPVISMQLLPGGTLKDRVVERGPMATAEAVASILNVIGGLDAAASAGILHRDIKPSNCFVDVDGSVKVGDFGLSISTSAREAQGKSKGFQGTPQYAPPEQLRGEPLDVRADIYAVGATLFYLLTGRAPFESRDFQQLVDQVKNAPPPLAHKVRPGVPPALSAVIVRCLAKEPSQRPASYADLAEALRPFSGTSRPATRSMRLLAGIIDSIVVGVPVAILKASILPLGSAKVAANVSVDPWPTLFSVFYFAIAEGVWATTVGKRLCRMRVVSNTGAVTLRQGFARSLIFQAPQLPLLIAGAIFGIQRLVDDLVAHPSLAFLASAGPTALTILLFATMRKKNGLAAVHDLLTGTRVVTKRVDEFRQAASSTAMADPSISAESGAAAARLGTFDVGKLLGDVPGGRLFEGTDRVLKRRVWLIEWTAGTAETSRARRDVDRVGRLHWLAGRRSAEENWDAFEAPQGAPIDATPGGSSWKSVQGWLNDLAAELAASERDGSTPPLSLDRVWIRNDGRAVLLDFPAPRNRIGSYFEITPDVIYLKPVQLLAVVAGLSLANKTGSQMPASAVAMLDRWTKKKASLSIADAEADLSMLAASSERVTRGRRLTPILATASPIVLMLIAAVIATRATTGKAGGRNFAMFAILSKANEETDPKRREAFEIYLASSYHAELGNDVLFNGSAKKDGDEEMPKLRLIAKHAASLHPTDPEAAAAAYLVKPDLDKIEGKQSANNRPSAIFAVLVFVGCGMAFFPGLISVLVRPSGIVLSALGLAVIARSGREISRLRAVVRLILAWQPIGLLALVASVPRTRPWVFGSMVPSGIALALMAAGVIWIVWRPTRGPHDIVAGTTIGVR